MQASSVAELPEDPQAQIRLLRETLLGGRGPGATPAEVLGHTRWRWDVAGSPVPAVLERTAEQAAELRGDAAPPAAPGALRREAGQPYARTVVLFALLLLMARRLGRRPSRRGRAQIPARAA